MDMPAEAAAHCSGCKTAAVHDSHLPTTANVSLEHKSTNE